MPGDVLPRKSVSRTKHLPAMRTCSFEIAPAAINLPSRFRPAAGLVLHGKPPKPTLIHRATPGASVER